MNRHELPQMNTSPDLPAQVTEIRLPGRSGKHDMRNGREVGA